LIQSVFNKLQIENVSELVILYTCIRVTGWNIGQDASYADTWFQDPSQSRAVPGLRHDCFLQNPFQFITQQLTHYCHYVIQSAHIINSIIHNQNKEISNTW